MDRTEFHRSHWNYYLMLERKFLHTTNYAELDPQNYNTFSNEYAGLLQLIGAELDSFFKLYCGFRQSDTKNIKQYAAFVLADYPGILTQEVTVQPIGVTLKPFENWSAEKDASPLPWWKAYRDIKHSRAESRQEASQLHTLTALSALFLMEMKYLGKITEGHDEPDIPDEESALFSPVGWSFRHLSGKNLVFKAIGDSIVLDGGSANI